ncbi:MAG TPA: trypsin-like peptidase domain-containing protein [Gemmatimonadales bacterium]
MKFGALVVVTFLLAATFAGAVDQPRRAAADQQASVLAALAAPQPAPLAPAVQPAADLGNAFVDVADAVKPAVVFIRAESIESREANPSLPRGLEDFFPNQPQQGPRVRRGQGSGFVISPDGYILTNNHVVEGATKLLVTLYDEHVYEATVVGRDEATDVAVIKIDASGLPTTSLGNSDSLRVGEWVLAVGNPLALTFTVTAGIVSAKGRSLNGLPIQSDYRILDFIQTDAAINPGNSGGPLVNIRGQVVGINSAIASNSGYYQGYGFAIPVNLARKVADQLIETGRVQRAILGISINPVTPEDAEYVGLDEVRGVRIEDFSDDDSPARKAGLRPGDIIIELDGQPVQYVSQLQQVVGFRRPGETVNVTILRRNGRERERHTIPVRLAEAPTAATTVAQVEPVEVSETPAHATKLGIAVRPISEEAAAREQAIGAEHAGLRVMDAEITSPARDRLCAAADASRCGYGDIITHVDGVRVLTVDAFENAVRDLGPGDIVSLRVYNPSFTARSRVVRVRLAR